MVRRLQLPVLLFTGAIVSGCALGATADRQDAAQPGRREIRLAPDGNEGVAEVVSRLERSPQAQLATRARPARRPVDDAVALLDTRPRVAAPGLLLATMRVAPEAGPAPDADVVVLVGSGIPATGWALAGGSAGAVVPAVIFNSAGVACDPITGRPIFGGLAAVNRTSPRISLPALGGR